MSTRPFKPHPFIRGGHLQTLVGHFVSRERPQGNFETVSVPLPDGDALLMHIDLPLHEATSEDLPIVVLLHGLGGSSESRYILRIARKLTSLGYVAVRFNHRGSGEGAALARAIYHAGRTEDIRAALGATQKKWPGRKIHLCSFSLSANMALLMLGQDGTDTSAYPALSQVMAICPPVDLNACSKALARLDNKHIDFYYTRLLLDMASARSLHHGIPPTHFPSDMSLRRFDELYTSPNAGFPTVAAYYETYSSKFVADKITVKTRIIAAKDDPIIPPVTFAHTRFGPAVTVTVEKGGGHMGFIGSARTRFGDFRWMDDAVIRWVEADS